MESKEAQLLIGVFVFIFVLLFTAIGAIFSLFNNRKNKLLSKSIKDKNDFKNELDKVKIETKDNTLNEISKELHDNIGQILSVAKMQVSILKAKNELITKKDLKDLEELIGKSIDEIRLLSRLLRIENFEKINLHDAIILEFERINRFNLIKCNFNNNSTFNDFKKEHEIIIFRIFQEALTNILKHSQTTKIEVNTNSDETFYKLEIIDYGKGFDKKEVLNGSGLINMNNRAKLLKSTLDIISGENGTVLTLKYPIDNEKYENYNS
jgi:signal transduction histidine kinase